MFRIVAPVENHNVRRVTFLLSGEGQNVIAQRVQLDELSCRENRILPQLDDRLVGVVSASLPGHVLETEISDKDLEDKREMGDRYLVS